jgi:RimJ/RimL family protein N-acetyltransferase
MTVHVRKFTPEEWYRYAEEAHKLVFETHRDPWIDRISYALMAYDDSGVIGYVTCRDLDCSSVYWQYGGALKERRGLSAMRGFEAFLSEAKLKYKRVTTCVENNNIGYLHLLMKTGFRIIGMRNYDGKVYLELILTVGD